MLHETDPNWPIDEVRAAVPHADALIAMTRVEADRLISGYGADPDRVHVVPPGVEVPDTPPSLAAAPPTVLYLGRISRTKGLDVLPGAMAKVRDRVPDARLVVAGSTTPDLPAIRETFAAGEADTGPVDFRVDVSEDDKARLLGEATVLVLPSERESFGMVLLEAWAAATPVVAVDMPVMRETVHEGSDGYLFPGGDAAALGRILGDLLVDPQRSRSLGLAGYERVNGDFTWDAVAARLEDVYDRVAGRS
jgi:glycosyltransferase involved in cell wall biosynthesis